MINIDTVNFTPFSAFVGGIFIGVAVILYFVGTGRLAGVSGIVNSFLTNPKNRSSNLLFLLGLVLGPVFYSLISKNDIAFWIERLIIASLFSVRL